MFQLDANLKRYTLEFLPLDSSVNPDNLIEEVDQVLLRLHPRITYKMGQASKGLDGKLLVEISVSGKRELLEQAFKNRNWTLPVHYEKLTWGWSIENEHTDLLVKVDATLQADPLAGVPPMQGAGEFQLSKWSLWGRYIILVISTMVMILLSIIIFYHIDKALIQWISILAFAIWQFSLFDTPLDFRIYAHRIQIREKGLDLYYWPYRSPGQLDWHDVRGLDYAEPICQVFSRQGKMRFLLSERFGCKDKSSILQTIVKRSGMKYVSGNFQKLSYRHPEAGDIP